METTRRRDLDSWEDHKRREIWVAATKLVQSLARRIDAVVRVVISNDDSVNTCVNVSLDPLLVRGLLPLVKLAVQPAVVERRRRVGVDVETPPTRSWVFTPMDGIS